MHDFFQIGTLAVILFGIMLSRYDANSLRREMNELRIELRREMAELRSEIRGETKEMRGEMGTLRSEMSGLRKDVDARMESLRTDVHRSTTLVTQMLFEHAERITRLEKK